MGDCHHPHDHGLEPQGTARCRARCPCAPPAGLPHLRPELHERRDRQLEQPSSPPPRHRRFNGRILWAAPTSSSCCACYPSSPAGWAIVVLCARAYGHLRRASGRGDGLLRAPIRYYWWPGRGVEARGRTVSPVLYAAAIPLAFVRQWRADALYVAVALMCGLVPDPPSRCAEASRAGQGPSAAGQRPVHGPRGAANGSQDLPAGVPTRRTPRAR